MPKRELDDFLAYWAAASPSERSNSQHFLLDLCDVLEVPRPDPYPDNGHFFEYPVTEHNPDGSTSPGLCDLYKRGCFVLESKQFQEARAKPSPLELAAEDAGIVAKKKSSQPVRGTEAWDEAMIKARGQAERYVRALLASEPNPPFLIVVDVGHTFELFADFTQAGKAYLPFPDPRTFRIRLAELEDEQIRERLRLVWTNPAALDPARQSADVTREVSAHLAELAKSLEQSGHAPDVVAQFLTRCLFCMFAEDIELLPDRSFTELLGSLPASGDGFVEVMQQLFRDLNTGTGNGISVVLRKKLLQFNGGLFTDDTVLPLNALQFGLLKEAARANWRNVEPAIFGTLLERALNPGERHQLGAHFTPRAYVERLVLPTVIEPLRAEWEDVRAAAITHARAGELKQARAAVNTFHDQLCRLKVLDPACGTGNFLYVALQQLKVLEGEVLDVAAQFGETFKLELATHTIDPHQFLGLEINPRAAAIAELVLWIGYLQWHFKLHGKRTPPEPILRAFKNIECRDAVLAYDEVKEVTWQMAAENPELPGLPDQAHNQLWQWYRDPDSIKGDEAGSRRVPVPIKFPREPVVLLEMPRELAASPVTVWDRKSTKTDPVTGRQVPDETQRVPLLAYANPRLAEWPAADYIVGNPPFIGTARMREDLGDGYAETLRGAYPDVPESADFVLYWWHKAAGRVRTGKAKRFGLITTNSLRQTFARRVVQMHLAPVGQAFQPAGAGDFPVARSAAASKGKNTGLESPVDRQTKMTALPPLSLVFAIPDHPWVDTVDGAAVRIAMTVGVAGEHSGELLEVTDEQPQEDGSEKVKFDTKRGIISSNLTVGVNVARVMPLKGNEELVSRGVQTIGEGFVVEGKRAQEWIAANRTNQKFLRPFLNGKDITSEPRDVYVIDFFGVSCADALKSAPALYQHLLTTVKPERDQSKRDSYRKNWWILGEPQPALRAMTASLRRYIVSPVTAKHRFFQFLDCGFLADQALNVFAFDDAFVLGVLSSRIHIVFALATGGRLGVGNDPRYNNSCCFDPFPFPLCGEAEKERIRKLAEELDAHRKRVQAQHGLTLTGLYNVLEKLRSSRRKEAQMCSPEKPEPRDLGCYELTAKEKLIHDQGLVSVLRQLHDDLDRAVADAYGWPWPLTDAEILSRLVALNAERAAEEQRGIIHWLRPEYQKPRQKAVGKRQKELELPAGEAKSKPRKAGRAGRVSKVAWPKALADRVKAVEAALHAAGRPLAPEDLARQFARAKPAGVEEILNTLVTLGRARKQGDQFMQ